MVPTPLMNIIVTPYDLDNISLNSFEINLQAMPDTGANKSLISVEFLERNQICYSTSSSLSVAAANKMSIQFLGEVTLTLHYEGCATPVHFLVCAGLQMVCLLSWNDIRRMEVLLNSFPHRIISLDNQAFQIESCLLYTSPSPRDRG